ncbi:hypothetical protein BraRD5C2_21980 [Bradyrhizobium sp. RD5-C2]|nr:hypothetical protein BraRD5C2_21980 [Bradyrhizobium sp. RD5-C2]
MRVSIKAQRHIRNRPYRQFKMSLTIRVLNSACAGQIMSVRGQRERNMGTIVEFPADAAARRPSAVGAAGEGMGTVLILPVVRIERTTEETGGGRGPEQGTAQGRRRRRRS